MRKINPGYAYTLPAVLYMLFFVGYPVIYNFGLSLQDVNIMTFNQGTSHFTGLENYINLLREPLLLLALKQTLFFTLFCILFQFIFGFLLALFFNLKFSLAEPLRGLVLVSWMIPLTVTGMLFKFMLSPSDGVFNYILLCTGLVKEPIGWLIREDLAMWGVIMTNTWVGIPFNMILLTTSMSTIPNELYESASVDGASGLRKLFFITLPLLKPAIMSMIMLGLIYTFKVFDLIFLMTGGGPANSTEVLSTVSYRRAFENFNFSEGAAVANILFFILLLVSLFYLKMLNKEELQ